MSKTSYKKAMRPSEIAERVGEYLKQGDLEAIVSFFHPECTLCFPATEPPKKGLDAVRASFAPLLKSRPNLISQVTGELVNGDTALLQAEWRLEAPDGSLIDGGNSTEVAKQLADGSWVYYIDCPNGPPPIPMSPH